MFLNCELSKTRRNGNPKVGENHFLRFPTQKLACLQHIREFVILYPTHELIELDLYNTNESSQIMSTLFLNNKSNSTNITTKCWGKDNSNIKYSNRD